MPNAHRSVLTSRGEPAGKRVIGNGEDLMLVPLADHDLFAAIPTRRTTRAAFDERELPGELLEAVEVEARMQGVETAVVTGSDRDCSGGHG